MSPIDWHPQSEEAQSSAGSSPCPSLASDSSSGSPSAPDELERFRGDLEHLSECCDAVRKSDVINPIGDWFDLHSKIRECANRSAQQAASGAEEFELVASWVESTGDTLRDQLLDLKTRVANAGIQDDETDRLFEEAVELAGDFVTAWNRGSL